MPASDCFEKIDQIGTAITELIRDISSKSPETIVDDLLRLKDQVNRLRAVCGQ